MTACAAYVPMDNYKMAKTIPIISRLFLLMFMGELHFSQQNGALTRQALAISKKLNFNGCIPQHNLSYIIGSEGLGLGKLT